MRQKPTYFRGKYRNGTNRYRGYDYGSDGAYFITICTKNRGSFFGTIVDGIMHCSEIGLMAERCWLDISLHFPIVIPDVFVIMPDHMHGIIRIDRSHPVGPQNFAGLREMNNWQPNRFGPQSMNLASIVRGYKIGVTNYANQQKIPFAWQPRYHDHIIRSPEEYERIAWYIRNNPARWEQDRKSQA